MANMMIQPEMKLRILSRFSRGIVVFALLAVAAALQGCPRRATPTIAQGGTFTAMGTFASVALAASDAGRLDEAGAIAAKELARVEDACSVFRPGSDLARLNAAAGAGAVVLSPDAEAALLKAQFFGEISGGAFDITVGPLMRLWGFRGGVRPAEPLPESLAMTLQDIGWQNFLLSNGVARLLRPGASVDLGGIAKGYGVDLACEALLRAGLSNALVNLGGNIRVLGAPDAGRPWRAAVRNPFQTGRSLGIVALASGQAVATSGHYEQFVNIGGRRFAHIMNPQTGRPVEGMASVTALAGAATAADALSTSAFVMGLEAIPDLLARAGADGAIAVPDRQPLEIWITPGILHRFSPQPGMEGCVHILKP